MIEALNHYVDFAKIESDLKEAYKEYGEDLFADELSESDIENIKGYFDDSNSLDIFNCSVSRDEVILSKGKSGIDANESDSQGSFYEYWIVYNFERAQITSSGYEQG